uniref:Cellulose synthase-like protein E1 n=1 Tax=Kalanchoe fedtschenkoi TaxID=63787 RepID=A0A7N0U3F7_KALFE
MQQEMDEQLNKREASMALPLYETRQGRGRVIYRVFAASVLVSICAIWSYRVIHMPTYGESGRWAWLGLLLAELWFGFYWILTQAPRWKPVFNQNFKDRLSERFESELPAVDVFVCTADANLEPPIMVINTVLSVMAYDYPPQKLTVYLSDDACSQLTFHALLEASQFAKHWLPYCKRFKVEPRSPAAYFRTTPPPASAAVEFLQTKTKYEEMEKRIKSVTERGKVSEEDQARHTGFSQWDLYSSTKDHATVLEVIIDGRNPGAEDCEGHKLPTLVYLAREKRPQYHTNYKAGAINALIRVSSEISNGQIILNVDCDMYSNNSQSVRDALCFFMDEKKGHKIAFVQFPQNFENLSKNDLYGGSLRVISEVEFHGLDGYGGPMYIGTGCFHRRASLCGMVYTESFRNHWENGERLLEKRDIEENKLKALASCTSEIGSLWGKEMGLKYGCPVEDVITGLAIHCRGWKSVYCNPARKAFLGIAPTTLAQTLVQHKRWSEGDFRIFLSKHNPLLCGFGRISLGLQMGYSVYCLWAPNCFATIFYSIVPSLELLKGNALFPQVSNPWIFPFAYVMLASYCYSIGEFIWSGGNLKGWWNEQRIWLYKRSSSYLLAVVDVTMWILGLTGSGFVISAKVSDEEVLKRYHHELMEFGASSLMFAMITVQALVNLFCFSNHLAMHGKKIYELLDLQFFLCGALILLNLPLYNGLFFRRDSGMMPNSLTLNLVFWSLLACGLYRIM